MRKVTREDIEAVEEIFEEMSEMVSELARICDRVGDSNARAYLIANLEVVVEQGGWMSRDMTLPQWIERLRGELE